MKKTILPIIAGILATPLIVFALSTFTSSQIGSSATAGDILQTNGSISTWVATSTLGISGSLTGGTTGYLTYWTSPTSVSGIATGTVGQFLRASTTASGYDWTDNASAIWGAITGTLSDQTDLQSALDTKLSTTTANSTYTSFTYASSTFPSFTYATNTYATISNYPTYSYASSTFASTSYVTANYPTFTYASSTYALLTGASFTGDVSVTGTTTLATTTISSLKLDNLTSTVLAVDSSGIVIATTTSAGGVSHEYASSTFSQLANTAGYSWTTRTGAESSTGRAVTYGNNLFVVVGSAFCGIQTSPNGINWTERTEPEDNNWYGVTYGNGTFVAVSESGTYRVMTSPDGVTWATSTATELNDWQAVTYGNGLFVAVAKSGTNRVMTSPDGVTWTARSVGAKAWSSVTYGNGTFVAVSRSAGGGTANTVITSPDGITWTGRASVEDNYWNDVTYGNGLFVAVAQVYTGNNIIMTSPNGATWTARTPAENITMTSVTYGNEMFVIVAGGRVQVSYDGINWTARDASLTTTWTGITYGDGIFVAVSLLNASANIMTSGIVNRDDSGINIFGNVGIGTPATTNTLTVVNPMAGASGTTTVAIGSSYSGIGKLCFWNLSNYTIMYFASDSITPLFATSSNCI